MPRSDGLIRTPDGELIPDPDATLPLPGLPPPVTHPPGCRGGLIGWDDPDATPRPCPVCRPDSARRLAAQHRRWVDPADVSPPSSHAVAALAGPDPTTNPERNHPR